MFGMFFKSFITKFLNNIVLYLMHISSIGKCALDANKQKDAPNGKAATCGLSSCAPSMGAHLRVQVPLRAGHSEQSEAQLRDGDRLLKKVLTIAYFDGLGVPRLS